MSKRNDLNDIFYTPNFHYFFSSYFCHFFYSFWFLRLVMFPFILLTYSHAFSLLYDVSLICLRQPLFTLYYFTILYFTLLNFTWLYVSIIYLLHNTINVYRIRIEASVRCAIEISTLALHNGHSASLCLLVYLYCLRRKINTEIKLNVSTNTKIWIKKSKD